MQLSLGSQTNLTYLEVGGGRAKIYFQPPSLDVVNLSNPDVAERIWISNSIYYYT